MPFGNNPRKRSISRLSVVLLWIALAGMTVGSAVAYLSHSGGSVENKLKVAEPTNPLIQEEMNGTLKSDVMVNVGSPGYAVYVRAAVVVTWKDASGNVLSETPVEGEKNDYTIQMNKVDWFESGGFWYCRTMVPSGESSPVLIVSCSQVKEKGEYSLSVDIITQTVQALGTTDKNDDPAISEIPAVQDAWGIKVSTEELTAGQLLPPNP